MPKNHRTALVIDFAVDPTAEYQERVNRLLESLNGPNIKVDIYTWYNGSFSYSSNPKGLVDGPPEPSGFSSSLPQSFEEVVASVASKGYVQVLTSRPGPGA